MVSFEEGCCVDDRWIPGTSQFRLDDYKMVMDRVNLEWEEVTANLLHFNICTQYYCAIKHMLMVQKDEGLNPLIKVELMRHRMKKLFRIVTDRKERKKVELWWEVW